jgi:hypothetical protein
MAEHNKGSHMTPVKQILQDNKTEKEGGVSFRFQLIQRKVKSQYLKHHLSQNIKFFED